MSWPGWKVWTWPSRRFWVWVAGIVGGAVVVGALILALWRIPKVQVAELRLPEDRPWGYRKIWSDTTGAQEAEEVWAHDVIQREDEARRTLAQIFGGAFLLVGLYLGWERIRAARKQAEAMQAQVEALQDQLDVAKEQQITERFTRAVDQLGAVDQKGDPIPEIRLGGIHALERIAKDSPKDHWPIMEILTAYVRQNSPIVPLREPAGKPIDIQAILDVLRRREPGRDEDGLDLKQADLRNMRMSGHFRKVQLNWSDLSGSDLRGSGMQYARLDHAILHGTVLRGVQMQNANFNGAKLKNTDLRGANLEKAKKFTQDRYENCLKDEATVFPDDTDHPQPAPEEKSG